MLSKPLPSGVTKLPLKLPRRIAPLKLSALSLSLLALVVSSVSAQTAAYVPDKAHSTIDYTISHLTVGSEKGHFSNVSGVIQVNDTDISKSSVDVTIETATIDSGSSAENAVLKEPLFFGVAQFPTAAFKSTAVSRTQTGLSISGNLTLRGVTKPVVLDVTGPNGQPIAAGQKLPAAFTATTTVRRAAFAIGNGYPSSVIGDEVKLTINLALVKQ